MSIRLAALCLASSLICTGLLSSPPSYGADPLADVGQFNFNPPKDGIPDNTTGGASRNPNQCRDQETSTKASNLTLLAPSSFVGHTISEQPDFFLYAEETSVQQVFINIEDEQGAITYSGYQTLPTDVGLIKISLPEDAPGLIPEKIYRVTVLPVCENFLRPDDPALVGYVKRIVHPPFHYLESATSTYEAAMVYAESGIWYDTLILLEQTLAEDPAYNNVNAAWNMLLSIGELTQFDLVSNASASGCGGALCHYP